jgi:hypothetical protein
VVAGIPAGRPKLNFGSAVPLELVGLGHRRVSGKDLGHKRRCGTDDLKELDVFLGVTEQLACSSHLSAEICRTS